jgi:hypothetical protein
MATVASYFSQALSLIDRHDFADAVKRHGAEKGAKGAVKLRLLFDHQGYLPCRDPVTDGKTHAVNPARTLAFVPGRSSMMNLDTAAKRI